MEVITWSYLVKGDTMFVAINDKIYDMPKQEFDKAVSLIADSKNGSYSIFCLVSPKLSMFIDENFESKFELLKQVDNYTKEGFNVKYSVKVDDYDDTK